MTSDGPRLRMGVLAIVVGSLFAALFARMWYLQVLTADELRLAADENAVRTVVQPAPRGRVLDRNGVVLVDNRPSNVVAIDTAALDVDERRPVLARLAPVLGVPVEELVERLEDPSASPILPVPVAEDVSDEVLIRLRERQDELPGVVARRVAVRAFPQGVLAAHLLGYVGEVSPEQLAELEGLGYEPGDVVGKAGVELAYDRELRGEDGTMSVEVDAAGKPLRVVDTEAPQAGHDVVLSIDAEVQRVAERGLAQGLESARGRRFSDDDAPLVADAGAAVVLDAKEGSVVALASYPTFDPAVFDDGLSQAEFDALNDPGAGVPQLNRAIQGLYAPGSTWKPVTAAAALRTGLIDRRTTVDDRGSYRIPGCRGGCTRRNAGGAAYGRVDVRAALAVSSDVFFYGLGNDLWARRDALGATAMQEVAAELGLGERTGVEILGERRGAVPTPALRAARHEEDPVAFPEGGWFVGDNVNLAIGQGEIAVTPIQIANAYATLANGGTRFEPNLALRVQRPDGSVVREVPPRITGTVPVAPEVRDVVLEGLRDALVVPGGTGVDAFRGFPLDRYPVAGKTGTAQAPPRQDTALFAAVAPLGDPRHVVTVVMEQAGFGSTSAAPVARSIFGRISGLEQLPEVQLANGGRG
ncbi:MAG: Peptidoglycan D,D-transpeptidase MrdA [uncultured Acidimicrobiales bacterium]|uniref:Peptidoglycan D,D-transpeptidase MrdA n=1 Tax=uncultured Acidimicrobiales bacterium TaxID=310071 RepID=A0A6J4I1B7_9ACTN|nr:MAG: Peptidoglycan D,D-transpeptidase MrdA [uncultured Acidimicrobiales bacterium]